MPKFFYSKDGGDPKLYEGSIVKETDKGVLIKQSDNQHKMLLFEKMTSRSDDPNFKPPGVQKRRQE